MEIGTEDLKKVEIDDKLIGLIIENRIGNIKVKPGYDGEYGRAVLPDTEDKQKKLI